jgi:hypothetical protein
VYVKIALVVKHRIPDITALVTSIDHRGRGFPGFNHIEIQEGLHLKFHNNFGLGKDDGILFAFD